MTYNSGLLKVVDICSEYVHLGILHSLEIHHIPEPLVNKFVYSKTLSVLHATCQLPCRYISRCLNT